MPEIKGLKSLDGEDRFYEWAGERYPSVTTLLKHCVPKPALGVWKQKLTINAVFDHYDELIQMDNEKAVKKALALAESDNARAALGTEIHSFAEASAQGLALPKPSNEAAPFFASYEAFQYDVQPEYLAVELPVFNRTYGYAGTADLYAKIKGKVCVIDIKTGRSIWPEVALQLAAYARSEFALIDGVEAPSPVTQRGYVLHLSENGYELRRANIGDETFDAFLAAMDMWRWLREDAKFAIGGLVQEGDISG